MLTVTEMSDSINMAGLFSFPDLGPGRRRSLVGCGSLCVSGDLARHTTKFVRKWIYSHVRASAGQISSSTRLERWYPYSRPCAVTSVYAMISLIIASVEFIRLLDRI